METKSWQSYEEVAQYLLQHFREHFGLDRVEPKQKLRGASGTYWEIDAKGVREGDESDIVLIECRQHRKKRLAQEHVGALAYRVHDTGADGGILVTPLPLQEGAKKIAAHSNIVSVQLAPDSTPESFVIAFFDKLHAGLTENIQITESVVVKLTNVHKKK